MGIFDFLKKKKPLEEVVEKINFGEIGNWIKNKKQNIESNQEQPLAQIKETLLELLNGLDNKIIVLKNIDLNEKKAPERVKLIVRENLDKFIYYLEEFILNLKEINSASLEILINEINLLFSEFDKKSSMSLQKSTFLIGKELGDIAEAISRFFKLFNKITKENEGSIELVKTILIIEKKSIGVKDLERIESENIEVIRSIEEKIMNLEAEIQKSKQEIEGKKQSLEYIEQIKIKNELETAKTGLVIELQLLRELIDFKALAEVYHSIEEKMSIIKEYKENFKEAFEKYGPENLIELVDIREINKEPVREKLRNINEIRQQIDDVEIKKDITEDLEKEINNLREKIKEFDFEKLGQQKRDKKLKENKHQRKQQIVDLLKTINVEVV